MNIGLVLTGIHDSWEGSLNTNLIELVTMIIKNINRLLPRNIPLPVYELADAARTAPIVQWLLVPARTEKLRKSRCNRLFSDHQHGGIIISGKYLKWKVTIVFLR